MIQSPPRLPFKEKVILREFSKNIEAAVWVSLSVNPKSDIKNKFGKTKTPCHTDRLMEQKKMGRWTQEAF